MYLYTLQTLTFLVIPGLRLNNFSYTFFFFHLYIKNLRLRDLKSLKQTNAYISRFHEPFNVNLTRRI